MSAKIWGVISILGGLAALALGAWTYLTPKMVEAAYLGTSYYFMTAVFLFWLSEIQKQLGTPDAASQQTLHFDWPGILFCCFFSLSIFISAQPYFRVLADETNLLAVSKSMIDDQRLDLYHMGTWYYGNYQSVDATAPTRPPGFPFLIHLLHLITGYRAENVFITNYFCLSALLYAVYHTLKKHCGKIWGATAVLLVCAQPIIPQTAASGGFDLANLLFIFLCFLAFKNHLENPSARNLSYFWATGLLYAYIRYESLFFFALLVLLLFILKRIRWEYLRGSVLYGLTPLLWLPLFWSKVFQLGGKRPFQNDVDTAAFAWANFLNNGKIFLNSFFIPHDNLPHAVAINWMGAAALIYLLYRLAAQPGASGKAPIKKLWLASLLFISGHLNFFLFYYAGSAKHPSCARFFILESFTLSLLTVMALYHWPRARKRSFEVLVIAAVLFVFYHGRTVEDRFTNTQTLPREYKRNLEILKKQRDGNNVIISDRPGMYVLQGFGGINFGYANGNAKPLMDSLKRGLYQNIYAIQEINYKTGLPTSSEKLNPDFPLEAIYEYQNKADSFVRISKVRQS